MLSSEPFESYKPSSISERFEPYIAKLRAVRIMSGLAPSLSSRRAEFRAEFRAFRAKLLAIRAKLLAIQAL